jgi:hypothetical protein
VRTDPGARVANHVWALIAVIQRGLRHANVDRLARLLGENCRQSPASYHAIEKSVHIATNPAAASDGEIADDGKCQAVSGIIGADGVLCLQVVQLLRIIKG